tara:strand:- start:146 stop:367 length:222 start_codon:yes stop_codon:yes gene_type:complete
MLSYRKGQEALKEGMDIEVSKNAIEAYTKICDEWMKRFADHIKNNLDESVKRILPQHVERSFTTFVMRDNYES